MKKGSPIFNPNQGKLLYLKEQFNCHMTFNFLNFCYAKFLTTSTEAAEVIELYADMLRYSLLLNPDEHVALFKEINYIAKFLKIQKCLHSEVFYEFNQEGSLEGKKIIPRLLIWLVENAFKHGQIMNKDFPIRMNLNSGPERIVFSVQNRKHLNKTVVKCGIGNRNIDQILELFYHGKYDLKVRESDHDYSVELSLKI